MDEGAAFRVWVGVIDQAIDDYAGVYRNGGRPHRKKFCTTWKYRLMRYDLHSEQARQYLYGGELEAELRNFGYDIDMGYFLRLVEKEKRRRQKKRRDMHMMDG